MIDKNADIDTTLHKLINEIMTTTTADKLQPQHNSWKENPTILNHESQRQQQQQQQQFGTKSTLGTRDTNTLLIREVVSEASDSGDGKNRLPSLLRSLEDCIRQQQFIAHIAADLKTFETMEEEHSKLLRVENLAQLLVTIPDKLSHVVGMSHLGPSAAFFKHLPYYNELMRSVVEYLVHMFSAGQVNDRIDVSSSIGAILSQRVTYGIVRRGHADTCAAMLFKLLHFAGDSGSAAQFSTLLHVLQGLKESVSAERMVKCTLQNVDYSNTMQREALIQAFSRLICKDGVHWKPLFTRKLLVSTTFSNIHCLMLIVDSLMECRDRTLFVDTVRALCQVWREKHFIKHTSEMQHNYVTYAVILMISKLSSDEMHSSGVLNLCLDGVHKRLHSSVTNIRRTAIMVAEKFSTIVSASKPLRFDEFQGELDALEMKFMYPIPANPDIVDVHAVDQPSANDEHKKEHKSRPRKRRNNDADLDPDELVFGREKDDLYAETEDGDDNDDEYNGDDETDTTAEADEDDTDSLQSFGMDEEDEMADLQEVKVPKYIREVIALLQTNRDDQDAVDKIQIGLKHAEHVMRSQRVEHDIDFVVRDLVRCLLHLYDSFSLDGFDEMRRRGMTACIVRAPMSTVPFLANTFYGPHLNISQRMDILDVLMQAAMELSNRTEDSDMYSSGPPTKDAERSKDDYTPKYPARTRRWGSQPQSSSSNYKSNQFVKVAPLFFHALLTEHDSPKNTFTLFGEDSFVLSKLIYALGTFVQCCGADQISHGLAMSTLEFVWSLRYMSDRTLTPNPVPDSKIFVTLEERQRYQESKGVISVRRSVLFAMSQAFAALPMFLLVEELSHLIDEYTQWLVDVARNDPDETCRAAAINTINVLRTKIQSLETLESS